MWTLTMCIGMFLSICGQTRMSDFQTYDDCERERIAVLRFLGNGYATCTPKAVRKMT